MDPIKVTVFLATITQMENIAGGSLLTPANILKFLVQLKNILKYVQDVIGSYNTLLEDNQKIREENNELKRRLKKHENAHTPPRVERDAGKPKRRKTDNKPKKKQGGQPGHRGATTVNTPDFESTAEFLESCECGEHKVTDIQDNGEDIQVDFKVIRMVTRYKKKTAKCVGCGKERNGRFYNINIIDKSPVRPPIEADPPQCDVILPKTGMPPYTLDSIPAPQSIPDDISPDISNEIPHTVQKTPVSQAPSDSDIRRSRIKIPKFGSFGMSVLISIILFWDSRSVIRRIGFQLENVAGIHIGTGTTHNILARTAECLAPEMSKILGDLLRSPYLHIDETVIWVNGHKIYIWIIATRDRVFYFPYSRHGTMLKKILGNYSGVIISDGYAVYKRFKLRQRCWAHLLREAKEAVEKSNTRYADNFYERLIAIFKKAQEKKAEGMGLEWYEAMNAELKQLVYCYSRYKDLLPAINKIRNDPDVWFTFMLYSYVEPTNNLAEQLAREIVKQRIMRQVLRTVDGLMTFTTLLSCMGTWRLAGLDIRSQLEKYLAA